MSADRSPNLVAWQWSIYSDSHRDHANLLVHILAVPMFWAGSAMLLYGIFTLSFARVVGGVALLLVSLLLQITGHKHEKFGVPLAGPRDFATRLLTEQFVNFPRFVATGGWWRNLVG